MSDRPTITTSSFQGLIGVSRVDVTPPIGIYARSWGAANHDVAEGIHKPLYLTCITFATEERPHDRLVLMGLDLMTWRTKEDERSVRGAVLKHIGDEARVMICLTHNHAAPSARRDDAAKPGGDLIEPYFTLLSESADRAYCDAIASAQPATLTWHYGTCDLATNRDLPEPGGKRIVCGFNPAGVADETLLAGRITSRDGRHLATMVNYACHPTTLAWDNKLISPDWVGAMRDLVASHTQAPVLYLHGASGELAPAEQYTGDTSVADRHGRRIGFAVMSALEAMPKAGTELAYDGVVESGAPLAVWKPKDVQPSKVLAAKQVMVEFPLKPLPSLAELEAQWKAETDSALKERLWRKRAVRRTVGDGTTAKMPLWVWRIGDAFLVGQPNEAYSKFQIDLRAAMKPHHVAVMNVVNGSAGYLPPAELYDRDIYQVWQSPFDRGSLEKLIDAAKSAMANL
jgi:hypothetical protein